MGTCQYKIGYLSLKGCGAQAVAECGFCNQPVCPRHMRSVGTQMACLSCYIERGPAQSHQDEEAKKRKTAEARPEDEEMERERARQGAYTRYGYGPHYYSSFSNRSRDSTDTSSVATPIVPADFQDS